MTRHTPLLAISFLVLAACASTPEPVPDPTPVVETPAPAPAPVVTPTNPVDQNTLPPVQQYSGPVPGTAADFLYTTGGDARVYFGYDQYDLSPDAMNSLRLQANWLQRYPNVNVIVEGNADERGTREYNLALGARRAESVKGYLVSLGIAPNRLTTVSYGKERPIDGRSNEEGWAKNRNSHTSIMSGAIG